MGGDTEESFGSKIVHLSQIGHAVVFDLWVIASGFVTKHHNIFIEIR